MKIAVCDTDPEVLSDLQIILSGSFQDADQFTKLSQHRGRYNFLRETHNMELRIWGRDSTEDTAQNEQRNTEDL